MYLLVRVAEMKRIMPVILNRNLNRVLRLTFGPILPSILNIFRLIMIVRNWMACFVLEQLVKL